MTVIEVALWSACLGVFVLCFVTSLGQALIARRTIGLQLAAFVAALGLYVASSSGLLASLFAGLSTPVLQTLTLASGAWSAAIASMGLRQFLRAHQRDPLTQTALLVAAVVSAVSGFAVFWLPYALIFNGVSLQELTCSVLALVLTLRAYWQGDRFARPMAWACVALVLAVGSINGMALHAMDANLALQALAASAIVSYLVASAVAVWRRNTEYFRMRRALSLNQEKDLLTQLWTGEALVQRLEKTIARARRTRSETGLVCVQIFNTAQLRQDLGDNAVEQLIYNFAARVRHNAGSATELGRYDDTSFMVIVENVKRPSLLRTMGLRLAAGTRRPFVINQRSTVPRDFKADIGVGIARLAPDGDTRLAQVLGADLQFGLDGLGVAQKAMLDASELAKSGQKMPSRVAILDAYSRKALAVEQADL